MGKIGVSLVLLLICTVVIATVNGEGDASVCNVKVSELVECLPAITGKSPPPPTKGCCSVMGRADLQCFCNYKSQFAKYGVDPAKAMLLPGKCGRNLPKQCKKA
ncbi:hypothetical protein ACS0TY_016895 [Phlomoides rotata]